MRITSLLGWVWESPLHLGGYSDLEKHPSEAVDPGTFDVRFSGDGIDSWLRGWMLLAWLKKLGATSLALISRSLVHRLRHCTLTLATATSTRLRWHHSRPSRRLLSGWTMQMERGGRAHALRGDDLGGALTDEGLVDLPSQQSLGFGPQPRTMGGEPLSPGRPAFPRGAPPQ